METKDNKAMTIQTIYPVAIIEFTEFKIVDGMLILYNNKVAKQIIPLYNIKAIYFK